MTNEELAARIRAGDQSRVPELWEQTRRFVWQQATRRVYALDGCGGVTAEDLYQSGFLALVEAVDTYDPAAGMTFIGWLALRLKNTFAEADGCRSRKQARDPLHTAGSLDEPLSNDVEDVTLADAIPDPAAARDFEDVEAHIWNEQLHEALETALDKLPERQKAVIVARYYQRRTPAEIAAEEGCSVEKIRLRERRARQALRVNRELEQFIERRTPYYCHVGVSRFNSTRTSSTEWIVLERERLEGRFRLLSN